MKIEYALRINALKKYQPSMDEIRAAVVELVWQKVEADKHRVEKGDFEVAISDVPGWVDESLTAARRRANLLQVRLGKLTITAAKNLKDKGYSNAAIAEALGIKESSIRSALERAKNRKKS
jgi:DNA-directed RNA polymerase specialized sigma24 family protein